jgi:enoyl-CoA hydratase/carnithine racemase
VLRATDAATGDEAGTVERLTVGPAALAAPLAPWDTLGVEAARAACPVVVVDGDVAEWRAAARRRDRAAAHLAAAPLVTVGVVRGGPVPAAAGALAAGCDLRVRVDPAADDPRFTVGCGPDEAAGVVARWLAGVRAAPAACLVAAQLLRAAEPSLTAESLGYSMLQSGPAHRAWLDSARRPGRGPDRPPARRDRAADRVAVHERDGVVELVLTRPERRNAFDAAMREQLCDALDAALATPTRPVVLRGEGPSFCAGGDLAEFGTVTDPVEGHRLRTSRSVPRRLRRLSRRLVVGAHGACVGAGVEFAAFARVLLATPDATFRLPEAAMGLIPGAGGTVSLPPRIGRHRTLHMVVTGEPVDAATAHAWGLVDEVVPPAELGRRLHRCARGLRRDGDDRGAGGGGPA